MESAALLEHLRRAAARAGLQWREPPYLVGEGAQSRVYRFAVGDEPPQALRVMDAATGVEEMRREVDLQNALDESGFPVPAVNGAGGSEVGLGGPFAILEWVPGRPLFAWTPWIVAWLLLWTALGLPLVGVVPLLGMWWTSSSVLRRLHDVPVTAVGARLEEVERYSLAAELDELAERLCGHARLSRFTALVARLKERVADSEDTVVCHGDFWYGNIMVQPFRVNAVIDWSMARFAPPEYDLAWSRIQHLSRMPLPFLPDGVVAELVWFALEPLGWVLFGGHRLAYRLLRRLDPEQLEDFTALVALRQLLWIERHPEGARGRWDAPRTRRALERVADKALRRLV